MKKVNSDPARGQVIPLDLRDPSLPQAVRMLRPILYMAGGRYCCLLGPDPQAGIFGQGDTPGRAVADWERAFRELQAKGRILQQRYDELNKPASLYVAWKKAAN